MSALLRFFNSLITGTIFPRMPDGWRADIEHDDTAPALASEVMANDAITDEDTSHSSTRYAEGQTFIINYADAQGRLSTRRISVWSCKLDEDVGYLTAYCHERTAHRTFRIDRIRDIIDLNGVVANNPAAYLIDNLGIPAQIAATVGHYSPLSGGNIRMPAPVYPYLQLLVTLARADDELHQAEIDAIAERVQRIYATQSILFDAATRQRVCDYVKRTYPTPRQIARACEKLDQQPLDDIVAFIDDAKAVMMADGKVHTSEIQALRAVFAPLLQSRGDTGTHTS